MNVLGQIGPDTIHYFKELFPKNGLFIRPDSLPDGVWIAFCESDTSQIGLKLHYKNGDRNGLTISFWPNGNVQQKGIYQNGCLVGLNEKWYENGIKESESNCEAENYQKHFYHCNLINYWLKDGKQIVINGTGEYLSYHDNGILQVRGEYLNRERSGNWTWYYNNGKLQTIEYYKNGNQDSAFESYYINGQIRIKGTYSMGKQVGLWEHWYQDGKQEQFENRINGKMDGKAKYWHRNGKLYASGTYKLSIKDGLWQYWDEEGNLEKEEKYINGELIESKNYR